ncbi:MAG: transcriptional regulator-like protein [Rhizobacter sp.]|nr:transcriptional regulator-like protein [Rhizobacter sp.]
MQPKSLPLSDTELAEFEAHRDIGAELLQAIREMKAGQVQVVLSVVTQARRKVGLSSQIFADLMGVSVKTLKLWERSRRAPTGAAGTLLKIIDTHPEALLAVIGK